MVKYYVDKDARKVVCVIDGCKFMFRRYLRSLEDKHNLRYEFLYPVKKVNKDLVLSDTYRGIATCNENDEWDEEKGKKLAYHRARWKQTRAFFTVAQRFVDEYERRLDLFTNSINRYGDSLMKHHEQREEELSNMLHNEG